MSHGITLAVNAIAHLIPPHASREHAAAALALWRCYHAWVIDDPDVPAVLAHWDAQPWPAAVSWRCRP